VAALLLTGCDPSGLARAVEAARTAVSAAVNGSETRPSDSPHSIRTTGPVYAASEDVVLARAWFERNFIGGYRRVGRRNPKWDLAAEAFIRESAPIFMGLAAPASQDLSARAHDLVQAGCDDPVVLYFAARATFFKDPNSREASELVERAVAGMHDVAYPRAVARFAASGLWADYNRRGEGTGKRASLAPVELSWFLESLKDGSYAPHDGVVLTLHLTTGPGESFVERNRAAVVAALEATSWVDPWVRHLFSGLRLLDDAWDARGVDYAGKVKPEGWKGFEESLLAARRSLTEAWRIRPDRPEAPAGMITLAMAHGSRGESPRLWFDRAVAARFDHMPAYQQLLNALRMRWSGDPGALLAFARECAETRRFDTEVPFMAFQAVEQMERDIFGEAGGEDEEAETEEPEKPRPPSPYRDDEVYRLVATVLERYRREPATVRWQRYASLEAAIAYKAGRYVEARKPLLDLGGKLDAQAREAVDEPQLEARIEAFASADGEQIRRAEDLYRARSTDEALPLFRRARPRASAAAMPYLEQRLAAGTLETELRAGSSVAFLPTASMAGWTPMVGSWVVEPGGALVGTSDAKGLMIEADGRVGPDFAIEADIEIASTSNGQFQAGIIFGRQPSLSSQRWSSFRVKRTSHEGEVAYFSRHFHQPVHTVKHPVGLRNHVMVQSWNGRVWAYLNGDPVVTDYAPEWKMPLTPDVQLGFGAYLNDNVVTVRYRNVRLRRLTGPPAPSANPTVAAPVQ